MSTFNSIDTHNLVSSKENIQPLRRGRDTSILCAALQAETDIDRQQDLERQRNEFEIRLRSNTKEDPLSDWCNYIHWIEQSFPRQAREGKVNVVLQKCLNKFKDCKQYMNDIRFVKLCIKYAELEDNTVELLSQIHRHGIGTSCAEMYVAWAEKYAGNNCFKKANAIYERGLQCSAQPIQLLQEAYKNFQAFLVRKMLNESETFQPTVLDTNSEVRQPCNVLQSITIGQKEVIPSVRTGSNVIGTAGKYQKTGQTDLKPKSNTMVKIFEDSEGNFATAEPKAKIEKIHSKKILTKENIVKPGTWNNKKNRNALFKVDGAGSVPFEVHRDEDDEANCKKDKSVPSSVLKAHKVKTDYEDENFANAPLFYSEPYDPTKVPMYCKEQVYAGGLEFQFEELRAIQYRKKREELMLRCSIVPKTTECVQLISDENLHPPTNAKSESHSEPKIKTTTDFNQKKEKNDNDIKRKTLFSNPLPEENLTTTDYSMNQTIHTKEALSEMQQLWFSKPASPVSIIPINVKPAGKSILKTSKPCFSLYVDESCLENFKSSDDVKPLDLTFKSENHSNEEEGKVEGEREQEGGAQKMARKPDVENVISFGGVRKKIGRVSNIQPFLDNKENYCIKENKVPEEPEIDDEDKENGIPDDYCGPVGKSNRKVSGILTPAENIEIARLSDEEVEIDEEEEPVPTQDISSIIQCNTTAITETWNFTKGFQFPRGESTPNVQKSTHEKAADCDDSLIFLEPKSNNNAGNGEAKEGKETSSGVDNNETDNTTAKNLKKTNGETENFIKNLSVIAESSREYRSSSSGSSGVSTLAHRYSKNFPFTPSDARNSKQSLTVSHTILHKTRVESYTGYETSCESSHVTLKTPKGCKEIEPSSNTTFNLIKKLNAIESTLISEKEEDEVNDLSSEMNNLQIQEKEKSIENKSEETVDPFSEAIIEELLQKIDFPKSIHMPGYFLLHDIDLPVLKVGSSITLGAFDYQVKKLLGAGSYARIFRLSNVKTGELMIAKYQKPAFPWEFYIAREIQFRIQNKELLAMFMNVEAAYFFKGSSVLLTHPVEFGDLLEAINKMKQGKVMCQLLAIHFTCQILKILETLHSCKIIHGDIKPDNFLLRTYNNKLQLQLIDFGRSIDMSLFPEGTTFRRVVTTEGFTTIEMKSGRPWTYQIDLYGAANCGHCLLFGDYMKVSERAGGVWNISNVIPRYWAKNEWNKFFINLLNVESCTKLPDLSELRKSFEVVLENSDMEFSLFTLNNLLNNR